MADLHVPVFQPLVNDKGVLTPYGIKAWQLLQSAAVTPSVTVSATGALDGDGAVASPLAVRVDGVTIVINGSNQLHAVGSGGGDIDTAFFFGGL